MLCKIISQQRKQSFRACKLFRVVINKRIFLAIAILTFFLLSFSSVLAIDYGTAYDSVYDVYGIFGDGTWRTGEYNLTFGVRSCFQLDCSDGSWSSIYTNATYNSISSLINNRYFQYRAFFYTENQNYTPMLFNATVGYTKNIYPTNVTMNIGNDSDIEWNQTGAFDYQAAINDTNTAPNFTSKLNSILAGGCSCFGCEINITNATCKIPFVLESKTQGKINISNIEINYNFETVYPTFSNYWDNNATLVDSGIGLFNVTMTNTNGTVWLEINNTNITATNLTENVYNVSYDFTSSGTYGYRWHAYGNGTNNDFNSSELRYYTISSYASISIIYPVNGTSLPRGSDSVTYEDDMGIVNNNINIMAKVYNNYTLIGLQNVNCSFYFDTALLGTNLTNSTGECIFGYNKSTAIFGWHNITVNYSTGTLPPNYMLLVNESISQLKIENWTMRVDIVNYRVNGGANYYIDDISGVNITVKRDGQPANISSITLIMTDGTDIEQKRFYLENFTQQGTGIYYTETIVPAINWLRWKGYAEYNFSGSIGLVNVTSSKHTDVTVHPLNALLNVTVVNSSDGIYEGTNIRLYRHGLIGKYKIYESSINSTNEWPSKPVVLYDTDYDVELDLSDSSAFRFFNLNITSEETKIKTQSANYSGALPETISRLSKVLASNATVFQKATLYFVKDFEPERICKCENWIFSDSSCGGTWQCNSTEDYEYGSNSTTFWFNVTHFTGYAGGIGFTSNLTIYDSNDTEGGSKIVYQNQQAVFYADYVNSTSGLVIIGATCNFTENSSGSWSTPASMDYNATSLLYEYNKSFSLAGTFAWNVTCFGNSNFDALSANDTIVITSDITAPNLTILSPENRTYTTQNILINLTNSSDAQSVWWYNGTANITYTALTYFNFSEGSNTFYAYANDSIGNLNSSSVTFFVDSISPYFTAIPSNTTMTYGQGFGVLFEANDDLSLPIGWSINWTSDFSINQSGWLENSTSIGSGVYLINIIVNDTFGNLNSTVYQVNVTQDTPTINYHLNGIIDNITIIYPQQVNASGNTNAGTLQIYRNGIAITGGLNYTLGADYYQFDYNVTGNQNYTDISVKLYANITKATPVLTFLANSGTSNLTLVYPQQVNITATSSAGTVNLERDGVSTLSENGNNITLGAGSYMYRANISGDGQNISDVGYSYYNITVNKSSQTITPLLNGVNSNLIINYLQQANASYSGINNTPVSIYINGTSINIGQNYTFGAGEYLYNFSVSGNQNYSSFETYLNLTINKGDSSQGMNLTGTTPIEYGTVTDISGSETNIGDDDCIYSVDKLNQVYGAGVETFNYSTAGCSNYTGSSKTIDITITKNSSFALGISGTTPITYGTASDVAGANCPSELTCSLNPTNAVYGAGTKTFNYSTAGNVNYSASSITKDIIINNNSGVCNVLFNETSPLVFSAKFKVYTDCNSDFVLYRNGTIIANNSEQSLGAGGYNFTVIRNDNQNYTYISNESDFTISQATSTLTLLINGTAGNQTAVYGVQTNVSVTLGNIEQSFTLYQNDADITAQNNLFRILGAGDYNFTAIALATQNYTALTITRWSHIAKDTPVLTFKLNGGTVNLTLQYSQQANVSAATNAGIVGLDMNNNDYLANNSLNVTFPPGSYIFRANVTGNQNYSDVGYSYYSLTIQDLINPQIAIISPTNGTWFNTASVGINYTVNDTNLQSCWWTNNSGASNTTIVCGINITATFLDGLTNVIIYANDSAGNTNSTSIYFNVDTIYPTTINFGTGTETDGSFISRTNIFVNMTSSDTNFAYTNITFYNATKSLNLTIKNTTSMTNAQYNYTSLANGIWYINATTCDLAGNCNSSITINVTIDTINPSINFTNPTHLTGYFSRTNIVINATASDANLVNITINLYNSTTLINSTTTLSSPNFVNITGLIDGIYFFNVTATDGAGNVNNTETRNVTLDTVAPTITLQTPADKVSSEVTEYNFTFNVTVEASGISSCSLIFDGTAINTLTNLSNYVVYGFYNSSLSIGSHIWSINCTDLAVNVGNSTNREMTINAVSSLSPQPQTGGGGIYSKINETELLKGYRKSFMLGETLGFIINGSYHKLTLLQIKLLNVTGNNITILIQSIPQKATISLGEEMKFDLNNDGYYDVSITLKNITSRTKVELIVKSITLESITPTTEITPTGAEEGIQESSKPLKTIWAIVIIALIVIIVLIVYLITSKKLTKKMFLK